MRCSFGLEEKLEETGSEQKKEKKKDEKNRKKSSHSEFNAHVAASRSLIPTVAMVSISRTDDDIDNDNDNVDLKKIQKDTYPVSF